MTSHWLTAAMCALSPRDRVRSCFAQRVDDTVGHRLTFTSNRFQTQSKDGKPFYTGTVRVDTRAKPAAIDSSTRQAT